MKIAIFGSGSYYQKYKPYLAGCDIQYIIDNDIDKQGTEIDGVRICAPHEVDYSQCVYVVILIRESSGVKEQLLELGISEEKIITYFDIGTKILDMPLYIKSQKKEITMEKWIDQSKTPKIMLVAHEFSRSGVPVALMNLAILLKKMDYSVLYTSMRDGNLCKELEDNDIDYITELQFFFMDSVFLQNARKMDLFILGTLGLYHVLPNFVSLKKPVIWWLHESDSRGYCTNKKPAGLFHNIFYYAGGKRVADALQRYWGIKSVPKLLYYLPDDNVKRVKKRNKELLFAILGTFGKRKAQDVLLSALGYISSEYNDRYKVLFVGAVSANTDEYYTSLRTLGENYSNIEFAGEMSQEALKDLYEIIDVLVCPSRDDPMPIVVTQAMQYEIPCIVSDQVGQQEFIQSWKNGYVFKSEDAEELACVMKDAIDNPVKWRNMGKKSREIYEEKFSEQRMQSQLAEILNQVLH